MFNEFFLPVSNNSAMHVGVLSLSFQQGFWASERLSNFPMVTQIRRSASIGDIWDSLSITSHHFSSNCCGFSMGILYSSSIIAGTSENGNGVLYFPANICQILWSGIFFFFLGQFYLLNSSGSHFPYLLSACTASSLAQPPSILPWRIATTVKLASCGQFYPHRILQTAVWKNFLEHKLELDITALLTLQCFIIALKIKF